jgi:hypothetical protein
MAQPNTHRLAPNTPPSPFAGERIEVTAAPSNAVSIEVHKGLAGKVRGFFDHDSLAEAGVLTATEAHNAQDRARSDSEIVEQTPTDYTDPVEMRAQALREGSNNEIQRWS